MASKTLNATSVSGNQGWYSASGEILDSSGSTITMDFSSSLANFRDEVDVSNITINSAMLYVDCTNSGAYRKKKFQLKLYNNEELLYDFGSELSSLDYAYNANDVRIPLDSGLSELLGWISEGTKITSVDPDARKETSDLSGSAICSRNYVRVTKAYIIIDYTVNKSILINPPSELTIGNTSSFTISGAQGYTNTLTLKVGDQTQTLLSEVSTGTFPSDTLEATLAKGISATSTSGVGTLTLTTNNGTTDIGSNDYSVTVKTSSNCAPSAGLSISTNPTYWLAGYSSPVFQVSGDSEYGATISSYKIFIGSQEYKAIKGSNTIKISETNPTGSQIVKLVVTDSRGYSKESEQISKYISQYSLPSLNINNFYRSNESGIRDDINGIYCYVGYISSYTSPIYKSTGESVTPDISIEAIITGSSPDDSKTVVLQNQNGIIPNTTFDMNTGYNIKFRIIDKTANFSYLTKEYFLQSSAYLLHFRKNQNSVGIGSAAADPGSKSGLITTGWPISILGGISEISFNAQGSMTASQFVQKIGALPLSGGTLTGSLILNQKADNYFFRIQRTINDEVHSGDFLISESGSTIIKCLNGEEEINKLTLASDSTTLKQPLAVDSGGTGGDYNSLLDLRENGLQIKYYASLSELPTTPIEGQIALVAV